MRGIGKWREAVGPCDGVTVVNRRVRGEVGDAVVAVPTEAVVQTTYAQAVAEAIAISVAIVGLRSSGGTKTEDECGRQGGEGEAGVHGGILCRVGKAVGERVDLPSTLISPAGHRNQIHASPVLPNLGFSASEGTRVE